MAIVFEVSLIVIDAIYRMIFWPLAHIFEKCLKAIAPSVANGYAPRAIECPFGMVRIMATLNHGVPRYIFSRTSHAMSELRFSSQTAAALRMPRGEVVSNHDNLLAAVALAQPSKPFAALTMQFECHEAPITDTSAVYKCWVILWYIVCGHRELTFPVAEPSYSPRSYATAFI